MSKNMRNQTFTILSAISIILVILGHLDFHILTLGELFPYYSYHVMLFVFISGYFYKPEDESHIGSYILRKAKRLLLPYFILNLLYGLIAMLLHTFGFTIGENISFYNLLLAPFLSGHQFMYNAPAWFVPALFLLEVCNIIGRKILSLLHIKSETMLLLLYLAAGIMTVYLAKRGSVYDYYKLPGRILFMLPGFQLGRIYKAKWEQHDTLPNYIYLPCLLLIQLLIVLNNAGLAVSFVWVTGFANAPFVPYLTCFTGIALWLRIAKILTPAFSDNGIILYLGSNTYSVMTHHLFCFTLINTVFYGLSCITSLFQDFDTTSYFSDVYYTYLPNGFGECKWIYLILGLMLPLLFHYIHEHFKLKLHR